jgi:tRNA nucleotidyltransferase/poly(A) polymerase
LAEFTVSDPLTLRVLACVAGEGRPAWMVGGFVRDRLLGRAGHDVDLIVPAGGIDLARSIARAFGAAFFVLDEERDVARAIINQAPVPLTVDVARLRTPELGDDLALRDFTVNAMAVPIIAPGPPPGAGIHEPDWELIDPLGARVDLAEGILRAASANAFRDDPLRTLRGVRLAVELGFHLEETTARLIRRDGALLARVAAERIREELLRIINASGAWQHLRLLADLDLLRPALPEVQALIGVTQSEPHYLDVFDHTRAVMAHAEGVLALLWPDDSWTSPDGLAYLAAVPRWRPYTGGAGASASAETPEDSSVRSEPVVIAPDWQWESLAEVLRPFAADLRLHLEQPLASGRTRRDWFLWAAMAHDWGKAGTRSVGADWRVHFYDHEHRGASVAEERLRLLACAANESTYIGQLVEWHMRPGHLARHYPPSGRALYRFFHDAGPFGPDAVLLSLVDKMATRAPHAEADNVFWQGLLGTAGQVFDAYFRAHEQRVSPAPLLDGRAVMAELGLPPGPAVGRLLDGLREAQAIGVVTNIEQARAWLHGAGKTSD